jgi:formate hydrogenlyase transcriptional activator
LLLAIVKGAIHRDSAEETLDSANNGAEAPFGEIVGRSSSLKSVLEQVKRVASTDATVLLIGETGTGNELVAKAIHNLSSRCDRAFVRTNWVSIAPGLPGLIESELFGQEKGAYTGAFAGR